MQTPVQIYCQWKPCGKLATKHIRFGFRTFGAKEFPEALAEPYTILHRNLCDDHVAKARLEYLDVTEYEIGECNACSRREQGESN